MHKKLHITRYNKTRNWAIWANEEQYTEKAGQVLILWNLIFYTKTTPVLVASVTKMQETRNKMYVASVSIEENHQFIKFLLRIWCWDYMIRKRDR